MYIFSKMFALATLILFSLATVEPAQKIIGGQIATNGQFPYQISLQQDNAHHCGGAIISERWIITAAHCVYETEPEDWSILVGTNKLSSPGRLHHVDKIVINDDYIPVDFYNDIALMKTKETIQFDFTTKKINVNQKPIQNGTVLTLSGWGKTHLPGGIPDELHFINLSSITVGECQDYYGQYDKIFDNEICTLSPVGEGACKGDSGGPLVHKDELVGVVSWGEPCAVGKPDVFTSVANFTRWINDNTRLNIANIFE